MKKLHSTIMMLALMTMAWSFSACGGDDENVEQETPSSFGKRLIGVNERGYRYEYSYDSLGRVTKIISIYIPKGNKKVTNTFAYADNSIVETIYDGDISYQEKYTLKNGRIIKVYDGDTKNTYEYNYENGYLVLEMEPSRQLQYSWSDGNLMGVDYENEKTTETYEYTDYMCPPGFFPFGHNAEMCRHWGVSGLLGKTMKNLPSKHTEDIFTYLYDWVIQDGLPIMMNYTEMEKQKIIYQTTYTFDWI